MQEWPVYIEISTHSLTRRLTTSILENFISRDISTHSLTRRLTACWKRRRQWLCHFNSQPHKEADNRRRSNTIPIENISTHSLTRRLTFFGSGSQLILIISTHSLTRRLTTAWQTTWYDHHISTHSLTRRLTNVGYLSLPRLAFQLTASQGGWRPKKWKKPWRSYFNSQPHKEADHGSTDRSEPGLHFNSQPHKEADI